MGMYSNCLNELYNLKKNILILENENNGYDKSNELFSKFCSSNTVPESEEELLVQITVFNDMLEKEIKTFMHNEEYECLLWGDYENYTAKFHHRKYWNEIENDVSVNYFLLRFLQLKKIDAKPLGSSLFYFVSIYDLNDEDAFFETKDAAEKFIDRYDCAPCTLFEQNGSIINEVCSL